jgi:acyl transferase domain-containing protein
LRCIWRFRISEQGQPIWYNHPGHRFNVSIKLTRIYQALAGGANLVYHPNFMKIMSAFNFLSPDSRCWSFDNRANGYARGEGVVMLVVKRLSNALRDGNTIRAIIRSTGTNQDGRTPGITQPDLMAQVDLIQRTYRQADIDMRPTRFFEAHGTGTVIGDYTEANAIAKAFARCRTVNDPMIIGAVKANIGHLEGASGLAGIVKTILVLEHGLIPPIAGFECLNGRIDGGLPLHVGPPSSLLFTRIDCGWLIVPVPKEIAPLAHDWPSTSMCKYLPFALCLERE